MKTFTIYTAGGMSGLTYEQQNTWRRYVDIKLGEFTGSKFKVDVINPVNYFNFEEKKHNSEREVMNFDLNKLRGANLIICNFNDPNSLGTMAELAIAYERRIPILGLDLEHKVKHPWQIEMCERIFNDAYELIEYVEDFYLS